MPASILVPGAAQVVGGGGILLPGRGRFAARPARRARRGPGAEGA